jgi:hypothetical protein
MFDFHGHFFWWLACAAVILWYSTITIYVAIRGAKDVRGMLERLGKGEERG